MMMMIVMVVLSFAEVVFGECAESVYHILAVLQSC